MAIVVERTPKKIGFTTGPRSTPGWRSRIGEELFASNEVDMTANSYHTTTFMAVQTADSFVLVRIVRRIIELKAGRVPHDVILIRFPLEVAHRAPYIGHLAIS